MSNFEMVTSYIKTDKPAWTYSMSKESRSPILCSKFLYQMDEDLLGTQYVSKKSWANVFIN